MRSKFWKLLKTAVLFNVGIKIVGVMLIQSLSKYLKKLIRVSILISCFLKENNSKIMTAN